jgi:hypothetical protein
MKIKQLFLCFLLVGLMNPGLLAQDAVHFEFGARAGIPTDANLHDYLTGLGAAFSSSFERPKYAIGSTFGVVVYDRVGIQFDAIYKPVRGSSSFFSPSSSTTTTSRGSAWEFPLVANYRFLDGPIRPFGGGGLVLGQKVTGTTELRSTDLLRNGLVTTSAGPCCFVFESGTAWIVNGGLDWRLGYVSIQPELRFTHWPGATQPGTVHNPRQLDYLVGFTFHPLSVRGR